MTHSKSIPDNLFIGTELREAGAEFPAPTKLEGHCSRARIAGYEQSTPY